VPYTDVLNLSFKCLRKDMRALRLHARYQIFYGAHAKVHSHMTIDGRPWPLRST
jgi:hypothetical protein